MSDALTIPLFPLPAVILPGEGMPLHIFEPRYRKLISAVEARGSLAVFGIAFVQGTEMSRVGCAVQIEQVLKRYDDGRLDILVRGRFRFRLRQLFEDNDFLEGEVEPLDDMELSPSGNDLREQVITLHARYSELMTGRPILQAEAGGTLLSWILGSVAGLKPDRKQLLLEAVTEQARLESLAAHYQEAIGSVAKHVEIKRVTQSNGVLKH